MTDDVILKAAHVLTKGGLILYPTDTVWGIGCDATNETAVQRIFRLKKRFNEKSMIILSASVKDIEPYVVTLSSLHRQLLSENTYPQTVILPNACRLAPSVIPLEKTIAVRCPQHDFCQRLLKIFQKPIVSTSANVSGEKTPTALSEITDTIRNGVDFIVPKRYDTNATKRASRIITIDENNQIIILRK
ncbi:MAG: threonylcarbamoyl-AMP synthase [Alphaproteobacteria bacterium]|nr:threonylcarbamoyl-AMP synthase [Alphaproteobacteria bacterium]